MGFNPRGTAQAETYGICAFLSISGGGGCAGLVRSPLMNASSDYSENQGRRCRLAIVRVGLIVGILAAGEVGLAREPLDLIPADSLLCWAGRPLPDTSPLSGQPSTLQTLLELGTRLAGQRLEDGAQFGVRIAEMFGLMIRCPHALALIDARARPLERDPTARRVDRLRFAMVVTTSGAGGGSEPFLRIIQKAVNEQTSTDAATLTRKQAGDWTYQELRDERLPKWAVIAWGTIGTHFVLTVGEDVWLDVAAVAAGELPALTREPWYAVARGTRRNEALIEIFVAAERIQERLDPFVQGRASAFFEAWDAGQLTQAHWALGFEGRALFCEAHFRIRDAASGAAGESDRTVRRLYADPNIRAPELLRTIPPEARYAIYSIPVDRFLRRFCSGLVATQGVKAQANIKRIWAEIQAKHKIDAQRDILAHLGDHVVLHNYPLHPLRVPLAMTTLVEIRRNPAQVRRSLDTLCGAWRDAIDAAAADAGRPPDTTLHHDADGIWYLRFGPLASLAWTTTDRFIISSWSPHALREYLAKIGDHAGKLSGAD